MYQLASVLIGKSKNFRVSGYISKFDERSKDYFYHITILRTLPNLPDYIKLNPHTLILIIMRKERNLFLTNHTPRYSVPLRA